MSPAVLVAVRLIGTPQDFVPNAGAERIDPL